MGETLVQWAIDQGLTLFGAAGWILLILREYMTQKRADKVAAALDKATEAHIMMTQALNTFNTTIAVLASKIDD